MGRVMLISVIRFLVGLRVRRMGLLFCEEIGEIGEVIKKRRV
jgi:hypothetical protein